MSMKCKTRVIKVGAFWRVQVFRCGVWQTMRDLYNTQAKARAGKYWWEHV